MSGYEHSRRYGRHHRETRAAYALVVASGKARCSRCHKPITPHERWHLDHIDGGGPTDYAGPAHARCNISAPGVRGAALAAQQAAGTACPGTCPWGPARAQPNGQMCICPTSLSVLPARRWWEHTA